MALVRTQKSPKSFFLFGRLISYFPHFVEKINNFHKKQTTRQNRKNFFLIRIFILNIHGFCLCQINWNIFSAAKLVSFFSNSQSFIRFPHLPILSDMVWLAVWVPIHFYYSLQKKRKNIRRRMKKDNFPNVTFFSIEYSLRR